MTARTTSSPGTALAALVQRVSSVRGVLLLALAALSIAAATRSHRFRKLAAFLSPYSKHGGRG